MDSPAVAVARLLGTPMEGKIENLNSLLICMEVNKNVISLDSDDDDNVPPPIKKPIEVDLDSEEEEPLTSRKAKRKSIEEEDNETEERPQKTNQSQTTPPEAQRASIASGKEEITSPITPLNVTTQIEAI